MTICYKDLLFETFPADRIIRDHTRYPGEYLLGWEKSLARLRDASYDRHPRPQEVFGLLMDALEDKIYDREILGLSRVLLIDGEWLSIAFQKEGRKLMIYLDPVGLVTKVEHPRKGIPTDEFSYVEFSYVEKREFSIKGKPSGELISASRFKDDLVRYLCGRSFRELPRSFRWRGEDGVNLSLPYEEDGIVPVRYCYYGGSHLEACLYRAVSRGVKSKSK